MRKALHHKIWVRVLGLFLVFLPVAAYTQSAGQAYETDGPPIAQQLVREGTLAVRLQSALDLGDSEDEATAVSRLADIGISPKDGWNADNPVTPVVILGLQKAVDRAAVSGKLMLNDDEALKRFHDVTADLGIPVETYPADHSSSYQSYSSNPEAYSDPYELYNYYNQEGPPAITYYSPPPDYAYMYAWVPYPFWWSDFWFPGFFIRHDFPSIVIVHDRFHRFRGHHDFHDKHRHFHGENREFSERPHDAQAGIPPAAMPQSAPSTALSSPAPRNVHPHSSAIQRTGSPMFNGIQPNSSMAAPGRESSHGMNIHASPGIRHDPPAALPQSTPRTALSSPPAAQSIHPHSSATVPRTGSPMPHSIHPNSPTAAPRMEASHGMNIHASPGHAAGSFNHGPTSHGSFRGGFTRK